MYITLIFINNINGDKMENNKYMSRDLIVGYENDPIYEIARLMKQNDVGFVPIANDENKIIGVVTDRDIIMRVCAENIDLDQPIKNYITKNIISVDIDEDIPNILKTMGQHKIRRVLVKDNDNKLVGVISFGNLLSNYEDEKEIISSLRCICRIESNIRKEDAKINDFYL